MTDIIDQELRDYREQAETTRDEPLSPAATRPGWQQGAKVLSVRLSEEEFEELTRYAAALEVPASGLVRGWILDQLSPTTRSPTGNRRLLLGPLPYAGTLCKTQSGELWHRHPPGAQPLAEPGGQPHGDRVSGHPGRARPGSPAGPQRCRRG